MEPVMPTTRAGLRSRTARAICASASWASSGSSAAAAPRSSAWRRTRGRPPTATNRSPGPIRRESIWTPVTSSAPVRWSRPSRSRPSSGERDHAAPRRAEPSQRPRATSRSSNGCTTPAISCPCSWPLPAIRTTSPGAAASIAVAIARARSGSTSSSGRAGEHLRDDRGGILAARVVGGDDRAVGEVDREPAHLRPLAAVAVAAAAEHADHAARGELARGAEDMLERARLVRVVDDHGERLPLVDRLESPRHARQPLEPGGDRLVAHARAAAPRPPPRARSRR